MTVSVPWWSEVPQAKLSQGDVIDGVVIAVIAHPPQRVAKQTVSGGRQAWIEESGADGEHWIARGTPRLVLVLSHSCELDKNEKKGRVLVAPVSPAAQISDPTIRTAVFANQRKSLVPLPDLPGHGDHYCDLRLIGTVDRRVLESASKIASLSDPAVEHLHVRLVMFFAR